MIPFSQYHNIYIEQRTKANIFGSGDILKLFLQSQNVFDSLLNYQDRLNPAKVDKYGNNAFTYSTFISPLAAYSLQRMKGVDINQRNELNGMTPLMYACLFQADSIPILLENEDIDISIKDFEGKTAFDHLVDRYDLDIDDDFEQPRNREESKEWINQIQNYLFSGRQPTRLNYNWERFY